MKVPDFESFCKSFAKESALQTVYYLRSWFITHQAHMQEGSGFTDFDELTSSVEISHCDYVSRIVDLTIEAFVHIVSSTHSEIIREDVMMPLHKMKEVDSYCINWLSRQSGRTIREKLAGIGSMMAVRRRESFDTGENRLLKAFARRMSGLIQLKQEYLPEDFTSEKEEFFLEKAYQLLRSEEFQEVQRWENLPPNNTLLSDKYYSKIWHGWQELRELDEIVMRDCSKSASLIQTFFMWNLIQEARKYFVFPQSIVAVDYRTFQLKPDDIRILGYNPRSKAELNILCYRNTLTLSIGTQSSEICFMPEAIRLDDSEVPVNADNIMELVKNTADRLWSDQEEISPAFTNKTKFDVQSAVIDIFSVRPHYLADNGEVQILPFRIMTQRIEPKRIDTQKINGFYVSAAFSNALKYEWSTYTLNGAVLEGSERQITELFRILGEGFRSDTMTLIYTDFYNDFQLAPLRRIAHLYYPSVRTLPKSIAAVFSRQRKENFVSGFKCGDAYIVADKINGSLSITLIRSCYVKEIHQALANSQGIQWEHHPQEDFEINDSGNELKYWSKNYGVGGTETESSDFTIKFAKNWQQVNIVIGDNSKTVDITDIVNEYISKHKDIIKTENIHILSLNSCLTFNGTCSFAFVSPEDCLEGTRYYETLVSELSGKIKVPLWKDHLPELAIKRFGGELFYLVKTYSATPVVTQEGEEIPISSIFTLPKGLPEHRFKLQKGDAGEALTYEAVVRHRVFPTEHDVPCRLRMIYHYGSDNPYTLYFEPIEPETAGFNSVLVDWQKEQIPTDDLPYPKFPSASSWESLYRYPSKNGKEMNNLFDWVMNHFNFGIKTERIEDFSRCGQKTIGEAPNRVRIVRDSKQGRIYFIKEKSFNGGIHITDNLREVAINSFRDKSEVLCADGLEWIWNKHEGKYFAKYTDGSGKEIRFYKNDFLSEADYEQQPDRVFYSLGWQNSRGWYNAKFIRTTNDFPIYIVNRVCRPDEIKVSGTDESAFKSKDSKKGLSVLFPLHKIFHDGRTLASPECPALFRDCVVRDIPYLVKMFRETKDASVRSNLVKILSLITCPDYPDFYSEANTLLDGNSTDLPYELGMLLGDGTAKEQQEILQRICALKNKLTAVYMLSRALWKNPGLVYNIPQDILTGYLKTALNAVKSRPLLAFEYVLAVLRLRSLDDKELNRKLSRNNRVMANVYMEVEKRVMEVKNDPSLEHRYNSRINFDDKTLKMAKDKNMPVFLYVLLSYITGEKGENEIKITEIKEE